MKTCTSETALAVSPSICRSSTTNPSASRSITARLCRLGPLARGLTCHDRCGERDDDCVSRRAKLPVVLARWYPASRRVSTFVRAGVKSRRTAPSVNQPMGGPACEGRVPRSRAPQALP
jgi:hypothetical protein